MAMDRAGCAGMLCPSQVLSSSIAGVAASASLQACGAEDVGAYHVRGIIILQ